MKPYQPYLNAIGVEREDETSDISFHKMVYQELVNDGVKVEQIDWYNVQPVRSWIFKNLQPTETVNKKQGSDLLAVFAASNLGFPVSNETMIAALFLTCGHYEKISLDSDIAYSLFSAGSLNEI